MIAAAILSGGASSRMGSPKALLPFPDQPLVAAHWLALRTASLDPLRIVVGVGAAKIVEKSGLARENFVVNRRPSDGPFSSLQIVLRALLRDDTWPAVVIQPVDAFPANPGVVLALARALAEKKALAAMPVHEGHGGHPVMIARPLCRELVRLKPKKARLDAILHGIGQKGLCQRVEVDAPSVLLNLNEPASYRMALEALGISISEMVR